MRLEVARDRSAAVVLDVAGQQVRRRGRRVSSDDDGDHFSAANRRSAHQRAGAGQVLAERLTVRLIRFYTLPTWDQRIQYQTCYNLPLSRAKLWVVSQLCCTSLQDVASVTGPGGPLDAALCMPAERSWDQPVCTVAVCCHVQTVLRRCRGVENYLEGRGREGAVCTTVRGASWGSATFNMKPPSHARLGGNGQRHYICQGS